MEYPIHTDLPQDLEGHLPDLEGDYADSDAAFLEFLAGEEA